MKRLIYSIASLILITTTSLKAIACTPKIPWEVVLEIPTDNPGSMIVQAYRNVVARFNQEYPNSPLPVKLLVTPLNSIKDKIATGLTLPNLYLSYADPIANYDILLQLRDQQRSVVNLAQVIKWDSENSHHWWEKAEDQWIIPYLKNGEIANPELWGAKTLNQVLQDILPNHSLAYRPFLNSFLRESLIYESELDSHFMYLAPVVKSTYMGVVNLRLLNELVVHVLGPSAKLRLEDKSEIRGPYFIQKPTPGLKDFKINSSVNKFRPSARNRYVQDASLTYGTFFHQLTLFHSTKELQRFLGDLSNIEVLLSAYWNLVGNETSNTRDSWTKTLAYATDDVFATTGLMQGQLTGDFHQITSWNPQQPFDLVVDSQTEKLHQGLNDFLTFIQWGNNYKKLLANGSSVADHGAGGIGVKANSTSKDYYSTQWINQGMLLYYNSSAGVKYLSGNQPNQVHAEDVLLVPIPVYEDTQKNPEWKMLFRQQGAGLGMFQDKNVVKNQVAAAFLNFFLAPEVNAEFAIQAGYIPTNYQAYYTENRELGSLPDSDSIYMQELTKPNSRIKGAWLIENLINQLATQEIKLWITEPSPFGETINFQIFQPWFQKYYKTFFNGTPDSANLTWAQFEHDLFYEAKRIAQAMLPGISNLVWNGRRIN